MEFFVLISILLVIAVFSLTMHEKLANRFDALDLKRQRLLEEKARCPACRESSRRGEYTEGKCPDCGDVVMDPSTLEMI